MKKNLILSVAILAALVSTGAQAETPQEAENKLASFVNVPSFANSCMQFATVDAILKKNGNTFSLICQTPDGGSVGIAVNEDAEGIATIHQTRQMNGNAIIPIFNSLTLGKTPNNPAVSSETCVSKVNAAVAGAGDFGDLTIKAVGGWESFEATCSDTPSNPLKAGLKALESFLSM